MKLSRSVSYALNALLQLAGSEQSAPTPCSRLAANGEMPERFLLQILRHLVNHGLLTSTRGVVGGYRLAREPAEISLADVIAAIEKPDDADKASDPVNLPVYAQQVLNHTLSEVQIASTERLAKLKISDLTSGSSMLGALQQNDPTASVEPDNATAMKPPEV